MIGATAVEDKLQDEVPETIQDFIKASESHLGFFELNTLGRYQSVDAHGR